RARKRSRASCRVRSRLRASNRSEEHTSELQSLTNLVCRLLLEKKKKKKKKKITAQEKKRRTKHRQKSTRVSSALSRKTQPERKKIHDVHYRLDRPDTTETGCEA